jgi:hypothetical protein
MTDTSGQVYPWYLYGAKLNRPQALEVGFDTNLIVSTSPEIDNEGRPTSETSPLVSAGLEKPAWLTADADGVLWGSDYGIGPYKWVDSEFPATRKMRMILR